VNVLELCNAFWKDMDDRGKPPLFEKPTVLRYLTQGETEAARRARLLRDSRGLLSQLGVDANEPLVKRDRRIIFIRRARLASQPQPLAKIALVDLYQLNPDWENATPGTPTVYCTDYESGQILLYPTSSIADTLKLTVIREPLKTLTEDDQLPELAPRYHEGIIHWARFRGYNNPDVEEKYDPDKARNALGEFEAEFGKRSSAVDETWIDERQGYDDGEGLY